MTTDIPARPIYEIAADIRAEWKRPYFGAVPYLAVMEVLKEVTDKYYADSADDIIRYFLSNASTFRGQRAREIKTELRTLIGEGK